MKRKGRGAILYNLIDLVSTFYQNCCLLAYSCAHELNVSWNNFTHGTLLLLYFASVDFQWALTCVKYILWKPHVLLYILHRVLFVWILTFSEIFSPLQQTIYISSSSCILSTIHEEKGHHPHFVSTTVSFINIPFNE